MNQALSFDPPAKFINANHRLHWAVKAGLTRTWRDATYSWAKHDGLRPVQRAQITVTIHFHDKRKRDVNNLQPTAKACVDGLVDAGVLPDDNDAHLVGPDMRAARSDKGWTWVRVDITELEPTDA